MSDDTQYLLHYQGKESGPFSEMEIKRKIARGQISLSHEILIRGQWITLHDFYSLRDEETAPTVAQAVAPKPSLTDHIAKAFRARHPLAILGAILALLAVIWFLWPRQKEKTAGASEAEATLTNSKPVLPTLVPKLAQQTNHSQKTASQQAQKVRTNTVQTSPSTESTSAPQNGQENTPPIRDVKAAEGLKRLPPYVTATFKSNNTPQQTTSSNQAPYNTFSDADRKVNEVKSTPEKAGKRNLANSADKTASASASKAPAPANQPKHDESKDQTDNSTDKARENAGKALKQASASIGDLGSAGSHEGMNSSPSSGGDNSSKSGESKSLRQQVTPDASSKSAAQPGANQKSDNASDKASSEASPSAAQKAKDPAKDSDGEKSSPTEKNSKSDSQAASDAASKSGSPDGNKTSPADKKSGTESGKTTASKASAGSENPQKDITGKDSPGQDQSDSADKADASKDSPTDSTKDGAAEKRSQSDPSKNSHDKKGSQKSSPPAASPGSNSARNKGAADGKTKSTNDKKGGSGSAKSSLNDSSDAPAASQQAQPSSASPSPSPESSSDKPSAKASAKDSPSGNQSDSDQPNDSTGKKGKGKKVSKQKSNSTGDSGEEAAQSGNTHNSQNTHDNPDSSAKPSADPADPNSAGAGMTGSGALADNKKPALSKSSPSGLNGAGLDTGSPANTGNTDARKHTADYVFLVDQSDSMRGPKALQAWQQVSNRLAALKPNESFYILFFHTSGYDAMPSATPLQATPRNIQSMLAWGASVRHVFGSQPNKAAERAFEFRPKNLCVISDGKFSAHSSAEITKLNATVKAQVNTVDIRTLKGEENLRDLAGKNDGIYRFIPAD